MAGTSSRAVTTLSAAAPPAGYRIVILLTRFPVDGNLRELCPGQTVNKRRPERAILDRAERHRRDGAGDGGAGANDVSSQYRRSASSASNT